MKKTIVLSILILFLLGMSAVASAEMEPVKVGFGSLTIHMNLQAGFVYYIGDETLGSVYDDDDNLISKTIQVWHDSTQTWLNFFFKQFTYSDAGLLTDVLLQKWNFDLETWVNKKNRELVYDDIEKPMYENHKDGLIFAFNKVVP